MGEGRHTTDGTGAEERGYAGAGRLLVAYRAVGDGPPLVFLHGFPGPESWDGVVARLRDRFRCVIVETLGLGDVIGPLEADYGIAGQAAMVAEALSSLGLRSFDLVGHDTGGAIAQVIAARWPERIRRLVLADCDALDNWPPWQIRLLRRVLQVPGMPALTGLAIRIPAVARSPLAFGRLVHDPRLLTAARLARYARPLTAGRASRERFRRLLLAMDNRDTLGIVERLRAFRRPTMIVWGCEDAYWTPSWAKALADMIPGARRLELIPFAGLSCHEERPDVFAGLLADFLGGRPEGDAGRPPAVGDVPAADGVTADGRPAAAGGRPR